VAGQPVYSRIGDTADAGLVAQAESPVHTSVSRSSCRLKPHSRLCFIPSRPSSRQRICTAHDRFMASPQGLHGHQDITRTKDSTVNPSTA
jgi:hypothetical protein